VTLATIERSSDRGQDGIAADHGFTVAAGNQCGSRPSTNTSCGLTGRHATARASAHSDPAECCRGRCAMSGARQPRPARLRKFLRAASRASAGSSFWNHLGPRGTRLGSSTTAAATTGPAAGPLPASSQPAIGQKPAFDRRALAAEGGADVVIAERASRTTRTALSAPARGRANESWRDGARGGV